jgi:CBS domain-containing protein
MPIIHPDDPVRLVASEPVVTVEPTVTLSDLATKLELARVGAVAVTSDGRLDGVISERDLVRAVAARADPDDVWAADAMSDTPVRVDADEPIIVAAERMLDEGVRHLPVMADGEVVGIVSIRDVLEVLVSDWKRTHHPA